MFYHPSTVSPPQVFAFDHCFWSMDESNIPKYAGESKLQIPHSTSKKANCAKCGDLLVVSNRKKTQRGKKNSPLDEKLSFFAACKLKRSIGAYVREA